MPNKLKGTVAWFSNTKSYGFIERDVKGTGPDAEDVFVHYRSILMEGFKTLRQGEKVEFEMGSKDGKPMAVNVRVVGKEGHGSRIHSDQK